MGSLVVGRSGFEHRDLSFVILGILLYSNF